MKKILVLMAVAVLFCSFVLVFSSCENKSSDETMHTHTMGEWKIEAVADCVNGGKEVRRCTGDGCNHKETRTTPPLGHKLTTVEREEPDCVTDGHFEYEVCSVCTHNTYEKIPALGHDYTVNAENPDGNICVVCGQKHVCSSFGAWYTVSTADCTSGGTDAHKCTSCNYVEYVDTSKVDHTFNKDGVCTVCGDEKNDATDLPDHEF